MKDAVGSEVCDKQAHVFLSKHDKAKLVRLARASGVSQSTFLRNLVRLQEEPDALRLELMSGSKSGVTGYEGEAETA